MAETITTLCTCMVRPSSPTPPHHMFLPAPDFPCRWIHYNRRILFFKLTQKQPLSTSSSSDSFVAHLKSSLALALIEFFPWAGRLFERVDDGRLTLDCNDAGVPFIEACINLPFSDLEDDGFKQQLFFDHFAPHGDVVAWTGPDLPLLSVQVTRFQKDEGFVLGLGHSHVVADGSSLWHFMKSWGECARGIPFSMHPVHMREELRPEKLIFPQPSSAQDEEAGPSSMDQLSGSSNMELAQHDFHFTSDMVRKLKKMAAASAPAAGHAPISAMQALSAHMWRHIMAATEDGRSRKTVLYVLANARHRLKPPLPEAYFGNTVARSGTVATREELQQESLGATALRVQKLIETMDDKFTRSLYGKLEVWPLSKVLAEAEPGMVQLQVSGSHRLPVYEVDFGWGPPVCVRYPRIQMRGEMVWTPGREGGGSVDISLGLAKPVMDTLEQDDSLFSF